MAGGYQAWPLIQFSAIGESWRLYKRHWLIWTLAMLIAMTGYSVVTGGLLALLGVHHVKGHGGFRLFLTPRGGALPFLISTVVSGFFLGGLIRMANNQLRGRVPRIEDMLSITDVWFDLILVAFLDGLATIAGFTLCVIPGFIVPGLFMLAVPLVVEGRLPATGALIQSWNALKSQWLAAAFFHCILIALTLSGAMFCGFGVIFTAPLYCLAITILYRDFFPASTLDFGKKYGEPYPEL